jgi:molybdopterin synthase catalytic subunit
VIDAGTPTARDEWLALTEAPLSLDRAAEWVRRDDCGAVVVFGGAVRDHADGRPDVTELEYEAYAAQVEPRMERIAAAARQGRAGVGRIAMWHRTGTLAVGEYSVVVAVSAAHRGEAFDAARYCIDTLKKSVPIWKRERWSGGEDWGLDAHDVDEIESVPVPARVRSEEET